MLKKLRPPFLDFSIATLNFLANVGIMLPYVLILFKYKETQSINYLVAIVVFYVARAASVFSTKRWNLKSSTYLMICLWLGMIGSVIFSLTSTLGWLVAGALCLGYTSANIWPYFLTIKLHLTAKTDFKLKRLYWLIFLVLGLLFAVDFMFDLQYKLAFVLLAVLFILALPAGRLLDQFSLAFYNDQEQPAKQPLKWWRIALFVIFFSVMALLTLLRKTSLSIALPWVLAAIVVAIVILNIELAADWKAMPANKLRIVNRGFLICVVLLFSSFFAYFVLGKLGMYMVFGYYLIGFEGGHPLYSALAHQQSDRAKRYAEIGLVVGHILILTTQPVLYSLGLILIALYVGYENPAINTSVYTADENDPDLAIINKYRFSTYGGLLCQLLFFGLLVTVSGLNQLKLMAFFNPTATTSASLYLHGLAWPVTGLSFVVSMVAIYSQNRHDHASKSV
ncbi:hypothetical protein [Lactiplantibacillus mudanjiangensis]|uniref:Uncharacterized protein n=1 Tax=Lactiplantibacillus mudanjiangensis TaxID=1296538 RepID=A0A660E1P4_9LACO|nr:hypothetical protein [Lactiplantibacillus mudanjiangensis]VDG24983.1 hypothetical protein [Lactobacillus sp. CBA3605] [Lactiplantibacillus mudanjiangensis]VDG27973.1 hypothetical protein [Lactobacillus sp. CBA3605] [Lactiplantibacillus mudanjiangensis]VDG30898.1 hypothetical protein [Lactobacillus sp. CBA3605] [Lactiplantibacillus mudanjiangensis]